MISKKKKVCLGFLFLVAVAAPFLPPVRAFFADIGILWGARGERVRQFGETEVEILFEVTDEVTSQGVSGAIFQIEGYTVGWEAPDYYVLKMAADKDGKATYHPRFNSSWMEIGFFRNKSEFVVNFPNWDVFVEAPGYYWNSAKLQFKSENLQMRQVIKLKRKDPNRPKN
jgi:hypothetical protein